MGSSGGDGIEYTQSPEQREVFNTVLPMVQGLGQYGQERYFGGAPNMGAPSMSGVLTGQPMYDIPSPATAMPTNDWWSSLAPEVKSGLYAPYVEAGQGLMEMMGGRGQLGSARGGFSGAAGAALGELAGKAAQNVGLNAWQMTGPMAQNAWNADLARNQQAWQLGQTERMADYNTAMNVWGMPQQTMGLLGGAYPQAYTNPSNNTAGNVFGGGLMGGLGAAALGMGPMGMLGFGGLGALSGLFS